MNKTIWAIIVVIIVVVGGWFIYNSMQAPTQPATTATNTTTETTATGGDYHDNIYLSATNPAKGSYMTDFAGKTLYTFDNDKASGDSSCTGACAVAWPPYTAPAGMGSTLPAGISLTERPDQSMQYVYKGSPLYYYAKDTAPGQTSGDGVGGTWHIVKM